MLYLKPLIRLKSTSAQGAAGSCWNSAQVEEKSYRADPDSSW